MRPSRVTAQHAAARAARSASALPTAAAAATAGISEASLVQHLRTLAGRGPCASAAARSVRSADAHAAVLAHRACPPPAKRAACSEYRSVRRFFDDAALSGQPFAGAVAGVSGWSGRSCEMSTVSRAPAVRFAASQQWHLRANTAANAACPPLLLERLAQDPHNGVRSSAARHPSFPGRWVEMYARDDNVGVRASAAEHADCPPHALEQLSQLSTLAVLEAVALHPNTPPAVLERFACHNDSFLRSAVASNPACSATLLKQLRRDRAELVRHTAWQNRYERRRQRRQAQRTARRRARPGRRGG